MTSHVSIRDLSRMALHKKSAGWGKQSVTHPVTSMNSRRAFTEPRTKRLARHSTLHIELRNHCCNLQFAAFCAKPSWVKIYVEA